MGCVEEVNGTHKSYEPQVGSRVHRSHSQHRALLRGKPATFAGHSCRALRVGLVWLSAYAKTQGPEDPRASGFGLHAVARRDSSGGRTTCYQASRADDGPELVPETTICLR